MTLPMVLTLGRIVLAPVFFVLYSAAGSGSLLPIGALWAVFVLIEVSDLLDGYFARKLNQETEIGKVLDPFADSICRLTYFICFTGSGFLPLWILLILVYRDVGVSYVRIAASGKGIMMAARLSGKLKAWVYAFAGGAGLALLTLSKLPISADLWDFARKAALVFFVLAAAVAIWSLFDYAAFFMKNYNKSS
jgi:CDP-diacylglycerol--glycerol-3-phosphate 3-phosphatidyltransferase